MPVLGRCQPGRFGRSGRVLAWLGVPAMDLGPVEADQASVPFAEEEAIRIEPGLPLSHLEIGPGPRALLGMTREGPLIQAHPLVLILTNHERPHRDPVG